MSNPNDIIINLQVNNLNQLNALSNGLRQLNANLANNAKSIRNLDANQQALNKAMGVGSSGVNNHAKSISQLIANQSTLSNEIRRTTSDIRSMSRSYNTATDVQKGAVSSLQQYNNTLKGVKARAFASDLKSIAYEMVRTGKEAQWTGRQLTTALTGSMLFFGRIALATFSAVDKQLTLLDKLLENVSMNTERAYIKMGISADQATEEQKRFAEESVQNFKKLEFEFDRLAQKYGDNKALVISLGVDFAQLGLQLNSTITGLAKATVQAEKLGDVDIGQAKDFIQTVYFQANKALEYNARAHDDVKTAVEKEEAALAIVNGTLARFNLIENTTVLSLRDMAKALPEAGAAATQFGLSMSETMALLAPMKAAGFDVSSSANAIKVSLQRLNDPTNESRELLDKLTTVLGFDFNKATHIGINAIDYLARAFDTVRNSSAGAEGAMEFMTQLFVLRQGPRLAESIADIANFNDELSKINHNAPSTDDALKKIVGTANKVTGAARGAVPYLESFSDFGNIARISSMNISKDATKNIIEIIENGKTVTKTITQADVDMATQIRNDIGDMVLQERSQGRDLIASIQSQTGKVMAAQLIGVGTAAELAKQEIDVALKAVGESTSRIKVNFQIIAAELIKGFKPVIEFIDRVMQKLANAFKNMAPSTKIFISASLAVVAAIGPLIYAFGVAKTAVGVLAGGLLKFIPGLTTLNAATLAASPALMQLSSPVVMVGNAMTTTASRTALLNARIASMNGPIGAAARRIGYMTGMLKREATAAKEVQAAVSALNITRGTGNALGAADLSRIPGVGRPVIDDAVRKAYIAKSGITNEKTIDSIMKGSRDIAIAKPLAQSQALGLPPTMFQRDIGSAVSAATNQRLLDQGSRPISSRMSAARIAREQTITKVAMRRAARLGLDQSLVNIMPTSPGYDMTSEQRLMEKFGTTRTRMFRQGVDRRFTRGVAKGLIYDKSPISGPGAPVAQANYKMASLFKQKSGKFAGDYYRSVALTPNQERRIVEGGILGALQKMKLRLTPTYEAIKRNAIRGAKALKNAVVNGFNAMVPAIKRMGSSIGLTMDKFMDGFQGLFTKGQRLTAIKNGISNTINMIGNGFKRMALTAKSGLIKVGTAIKNSKLGQAFHTLFTDPKKALTSFITIVKARTKQAYDVLKTRFAQIKAMNARFAATNIGAKVGKLTNFASEIIGWKAIKKAIYEAQFAALEYEVTQQVFGGKVNPFIKLTKSVKAFTMSLFKSMNIMKMLKLVLMGMGITAIILTATAAVAYLINGFRNLGSAGDGIKKKFSTAFGTLRQVVIMVIKPFKDAFYTILTLMTGASDAKTQFSRLGDGLMQVANAVKAFFEKYVVPALNFMLVGSVNLIRSVTKFIQGLINIFKGDWKKGLGQMLQAVSLFANVVIKIVVKIAILWIKGYTLLYKKLAEGVGGLAKAIMHFIGSAIKWCIEKFKSLISTITDFMKHIPGLSHIRKALLSGIQGAADGAQKLFDGMGSGIDSLMKTLGGAIQKGGDLAVGALNTLGDWATGMLDKVIQSTKGLMESAGKNMVKDAEDRGQEYADAFTDPVAAGIDKVIGEADGALADFIKDLKQKFVDLVLGQVAEKVSEVVDSLRNALEDQKNSALDVYNTQIETLDKLAKAEESLTKEKEYQVNRRKMIDERALQIQNYQRERALAIYEGRIDDARLMALEDQKNSLEYASNLANLDESRRKDLAQENLDALKDAINSARDQAEKFFDEQIKGFEEAAKKITQFPPQTIEEYKSMLDQLNTAASDIAQENSNIFTDMLNDMANNIALPNEAVGVFATSLDQLVTTAQSKYGLTDTSDQNTIVGATVSMLSGIEGQMVGSHDSIVSAFAGIVDNIFDTSMIFTTIGESIFLPAMEDIAAIIEENNPFTVFEEGIRIANQTLLREITGTVGAIGSVVDGLAERIDQLVVRLGVVNFLKDQTAGATTGDTGAGYDLGNLGEPATGPNNYVGSRPPTYGAYEAILKKVTADFEANKNKVQILKLMNPTEKANFIKRTTERLFQFQKATITYTAAQKYTAAQQELARIEQSSDALMGPFFKAMFKLRYGGRVPAFGNGGYIVKGFPSQGVPGILHGGEYVVNANAVRNIGYATLENLNKMRFATPQAKTPEYGGASSSTTTTNIYVENFIGEDEWFNSMLKQYNMNVLPAKQKSAGMENRTITTYSGLSRGM